MAEFIEREKALEECDWYANEFCECEYAIMPLKGALEIIPAADVRPVVRGKWIPDYDYAEYDYDGSTPLPEPLKFQDGWQCSLCGWYMPSETNFCPNCGADMREES